MSTHDIDPNITKLDKVISDAIDELENEDVRSDQFGTMLDRTTKVHKIRTALAAEEPEKVIEQPDKDRVRFKDVLPIIGSLGGIAIIVIFEAFGHTLTSKATAFVSKSK